MKLCCTFYPSVFPYSHSNHIGTFLYFRTRHEKILARHGRIVFASKKIKQIIKSNIFNNYNCVWVSHLFYYFCFGSLQVTIRLKRFSCVWKVPMRQEGSSLYNSKQLGTKLKGTLNRRAKGSAICTEFRFEWSKQSSLYFPFTKKIWAETKVILELPRA